MSFNEKVFVDFTVLEQLQRRGFLSMNYVVLFTSVIQYEFSVFKVGVSNMQKKKAWVKNVTLPKAAH